MIKIYIVYGKNVTAGSVKYFKAYWYNTHVYKIQTISNSYDNLI